MSAPLVGDDDHPLLFQLKGIRAALALCQEECHASAVKFQRRSLDNAQSHERAERLQRENDLLKAEIAILRASPAQSELSSESKAHIQELTLSLRRLSHKLTLTEGTLLERTKELLSAQAEVVKVKAARNAANGVVDGLRAREEAERITTRDLALRVRKQEEELRMSDVVICEYAELVRQLEARSRTGYQEGIHTEGPTLDSALSQGRFDLHQVIESFRSQYDETYLELEKTRGELEFARSQLVAKEQAEHTVMENFASTKAELDQLKVNDETAAKMVARYMQFSQSSTDSLLASLEALKTRHSATMSTLSSQNQLLLTRIRSLELQNEHLRTNLDDLGGEVLKEKYGRRREIGLRIRMGGREQRIVEGLRRWLRQSEEAVKRLYCQETGAQDETVDRQNALLTLSQDARIFLDSLEHGGADEETAVSISGPRARELIAHGGVDELLEELRMETERRVMLQISGNDKPVDVVEERHLEFNIPEFSPPQGDRNSKGISGLLPSPVAQVDQIRGQEKTVVVTPSNADVEDSRSESGLSSVKAVIVPQSILSNLPSSRHAEKDADTTPDQISTKNPDDSRQLEAVKDFLSQHHDPTDENPIESPSYSTVVPPPKMNASLDVSLPTPVATRVQAGVDTGPLVPLSPKDSSVSHSASPVDSGPPSRYDRQGSQETLNMDTATSISLSPITSHFPDLAMQHITEGRPQENLPHPLLAELAEVNKRYEVVQREFRDCHLALEGLKESLRSLSGSQSGAPSTEGHFFPLESLRTAVARLDDFTEDVRVEIDIKIGDEVLVIKGYEALLQVPGALSSYTRGVEVSCGASGAQEAGDDKTFSRSVEEQIKAFIDGTEPTVKCTEEMFKIKLEDVQHDIAILKRAIHDPEFILSEQSLPALASTSSTSLPTSQKMELGFNPTARPVGGGWSSWIRGSSMPSPGFGLSSTYGNITTSPRSRQSSLQTADHKFAEGESSGGLGILGSFIGLPGKDAPPSRDPLSVLPLRIAMPSHTTDGYGNGLVSSTPISALSGSIRSPSYPFGLGVGPPPTPRPRSSSTMYMLGLGVYGSGVSRTASINSNGTIDTGVELEKDTDDHDVE